MIQQIILIPYTEAEFRSLMQEEFAKALRQQSPLTPRPAKYLNVVETAAYLKLAKQTVYGEHSKGKLTGIKANGRLLFLQEDLDNYLMAGRSTVQDVNLYKGERKGRTR